MKYKVIEEYKNYYLCEHSNGYRACFLKSEYHPDKNGYIHERISIQKGPGEYKTDPSKINRSWNGGIRSESRII